MVRCIYGMVFFLLLMSIVSADIYIDDDSLERSNVGDEINLPFSVSPANRAMGFVDVYLICDSDERLVFKEYSSFLNEPVKNYSVSALVEIDGVCYFDVRFNDEVSSSKEFKISNELITDVFFNSRVYRPGESVVVNGTTRKLNDGDFNYSVRVLFNDEQIKNLGFYDNDFSFEFVLDSEIAAGEYDLKIVLEEKNLFGEVINDYVYNGNFSVLRVPREIVVDCLESFKPPHNFEYELNLFDQSGAPIFEETLSVKIYDPNNDLLFDSTVLSGELMNYSFPGDSMIGGYRMNVFYGSINLVKPIYVNENREVFVDFLNGTSYVSIQNVGNIAYEGVIEVSLFNSSGETKVPINVNLGIGDSVNEKIPHSGDFNLSVSGREFSNVYITGAAISGGGKISMIVLGITIVFIVVLILFYFYSRYKNSLGKKEGSSNLRPSVLSSSDSGVKFIHPKKKGKIASAVQRKPQSVKVFRDESPGTVSAMILEDKKNKDIDISSYPSESLEVSEPKKFEEESTGVEDIPLVKNALREIRKVGSQVASSKGVSARNVASSKKAEISKKKVYSLFFRNDSSELVDILKKYGLGIYKVGDLRFSLLKSSKSPEKLILNLAKTIAQKTGDSDILIHSMDFENSHNLSSLFKSIQSVLREGEGILLSAPIYSALERRDSIEFFKNLKARETIIKLYKLVL